jgi:ABC-2 type transport system ATP-binding protein
MSAECAIQIRELQHRYEADSPVLQGVDLDVLSGEMIGLLGPNGSGKSTLFRILGTLLPMQSGSVSMLGLNLASDASLIRERIGISFQSPALDGRLTVRENLKCHSRIFGIPREQYNRRSSELLSRFGIETRGADTVQTLSGGQKRRVELVMTLLHSPDILLLDEPTAGLDPASRREFWNTLKQFRSERQTTIVVATHLMDEAEFCDSLALLSDGRVAITGAPAQLRTELGHTQFRLRCHQPASVGARLKQSLQTEIEQHGDVLTFPAADPSAQLDHLLQIVGEDLISVELARPTLQDVFLHHTGHSLIEETSSS